MMTIAELELRFKDIPKTDEYILVMNNIVAHEELELRFKDIPKTEEYYEAHRAIVNLVATGVPVAETKPETNITQAPATAPIAPKKPCGKCNKSKGTIR